MRRTRRVAFLLALFASSSLMFACADGSNGGSDAAGDATDTPGNDGDTALFFSVGSLSPSSGPVAGGTTVVISGTGFVSGATVDFGGTPGEAPSLISEFQVSVRTPAASGPGAVDVTVQLPDGRSATLFGAFTYTEQAAPTIGWCALHWPSSTGAQPNAETEPIFGRVFVEGCSELDAQCGAVVGHLGYGPLGSDPSTNPDTWAWQPAAYNTAHVDGNNDEYMGTLAIAAEGQYAYAYRFSVDGESNWTYCDLDGTDNGVQTAQLGNATIAVDRVAIGWCTLHFPVSTSTEPGVATEAIYGRVFAEGCTELDAQCAEITAQLGYGPQGSDVPAAPEAFTWVPAAVNPGHTTDNNDEYQATITTSAEGTWSYAYRFSADAGATWAYCDLDGTDNGYQPGQTGTLTVGSAPTDAIDWCQLQWPPSTAVAPGGQTEPFYGRVHVTGGCTNGAAQCAGVTAQAGFGPQGSDPSTTPGDFTWADATYNDAHTADDNDEYQAVLTGPNTGSFVTAYRFSLDGGTSWTYCDTSGDDGFQAAQLGALEVATRPIAWCNVQWPQTTSGTVGTPTEKVYGRVLSVGCTEGTAYCGGLRAELGFGNTASDPSSNPSSWTWTAATYNAGHTSDNNDEYEAAITPTATGTFGYVYRFSGDGGSTWSYCDTTGDAFSVADAGALTVN